MVETMLFSSQLLLMHSHDFLDQRIIENGYFVPHYETGRLETAISEIVKIMNFSTQKRNLVIMFDASYFKKHPPLRFDKRRL